jgi:hypothetical protein
MPPRKIPDIWIPPAPRGAMTKKNLAALNQRAGYD